MSVAAGSPFSHFCGFCVEGNGVDIKLLPLNKAIIAYYSLKVLMTLR